MIVTSFNDAVLHALREKHGLKVSDIVQLTELAGQPKSGDTIRGQSGRARRKGVVKDAVAAAVPDESNVLDTLFTQLASRPGYTRGIIAADQHFPDHDKRYIDLHVQISKYFMPDITILNGDTFDFGAVSKFQQSRHSKRGDVLSAIESPYSDYVHRLDDSAGYIIHNSGNHNYRVDSWLNLFPQFDETILQRYERIATHNGRVIWTEFQEEFDLNGLQIDHGKRIGENAAKLSAQDMGFVPHVQNHTHQAGVYYKRTLERYNTNGVVRNMNRIIISMVGGCLCKIKPEYQETTKFSKWIPGIILFHINNKDSWDIHMQQVIFHDRPDGSAVAAVGAEVFNVAG